MLIPQPLNPVINQAKTTIAKADADSFLTGILASTPLPSGKTADQITRYDATAQADGSIAVLIQFKPTL
jgi:hypothetical protein